MTPREVAEGLLACHCGKAGVKQDWGLVKEAAGNAVAAYTRCNMAMQYCQCQAAPWSVMPGVPFQLTEWRQDLVACNCGAEGRLVQTWNIAWRDRPMSFLSVNGAPSWMGTRGACPFVLLEERFCSGCHDLSGGMALYRPWYAVPGVDLLVGPESRLTVPSGGREPLVGRYCPLEG